MSVVEASPVAAKVIPQSPDDDLKCLLVQPKFAMTNYWNFIAPAEAVGAKTMAPPLGLITVAALLPQNWTFKLVDLNVGELNDADWDDADIICTGGMIPQQLGILEIVERANREGKYCAVGGPDPTSQPQLYTQCDALVVGEGENSIPLWLDSWRNGEPCGTFEVTEKPDVSKSPAPRFDLVNVANYLQFGVQLSRGCPFNCEFCDIIELYGRIPRSKTPEQFLAEMEIVYQLGYRGWIDIADDNFIGSKPQVKKLLRAVIEWSRERNHPFFFTCEATMNMADDDELLELMREADFRWVFMGIETPDPDVMVLTQKRVNKMKPIVERIHRIYDYGIAISAGFILGFDNEKPNNDAMMISCIEDTGIVTAMVGLLTALPNTQLTRRLQKEGRLLLGEQVLFEDDDRPYELVVGDECEQTSGGLNFVTTRDRVEVLTEFRNVIDAVYSPRNYMDRILDTTKRLKPKRNHKGSWFEAKRFVRGFFNIAWWMIRNRHTRWLYLRNTLRSIPMGFAKFEFAQSNMSLYMHFGPQTKHIRDRIDGAIHFAENDATFPRQVPDDQKRPTALPVVSAESCGT